MQQLAANRRVTSPALKKSAARWATLLDAQREAWRDSMGTPTRFRQDATLQRAAALFERRVECYGELLPLLDLGPESAPRELTSSERAVLVRRLREWFYSGVSGLLLSGRALEQFLRVQDLLADPDVTPEDLRDGFSRFRTDLKVDLGVRQPQETSISMSWPEDERW
ncbi:MAG: hypothetical protein R2878_06745 [Thermoleophilia bacterium]